MTYLLFGYLLLTYAAKWLTGRASTAEIRAELSAVVHAPPQDTEW